MFNPLPNPRNPKAAAVGAEFWAAALHSFAQLLMGVGSSRHLGRESMKTRKTEGFEAEMVS
jgi:hypothetical protein